LLLISVITQIYPAKHAKKDDIRQHTVILLSCLTDDCKTDISMHLYRLY